MPTTSEIRRSDEREGQSDSREHADNFAAELKDSVSRFVADFDHLGRVRELRGTVPGFDPGVLRMIGDLGWLAVRVPEAQGGLGLPPSAMAVILRGLGAALLPEPVAALAVVGARVLAETGNVNFRERHLPGLLAGGFIPALAVIDGADTPVRVTRAGRRHVLAGTKSCAFPGQGSDGFLCSADGGDGPEVYWLTPDQPGLHTKMRQRADGSWAAELNLDNVSVGEDARLLHGPRAALVLDDVIAEAVVMSAAELCGLADRLLAITLAHLRERKQFDRPIGAFQALQHRAVDMFMQKELAEAALADALTAFDTSCEFKSRGAAASRAKARCAHGAMLIVREAIQMHGAMGYTDECDVSLYMKRALVLSAWLGNAADHRRRHSNILGLDRAEHDHGAPPKAAPAPFVKTDWDRLDDEVFRATVRQYFETHYPEHLRNPSRRMHWHETEAWYRRMSEIGWLALSWPSEYGGAGLSTAKQLIFIEEQERWGIARPPDMGVTIVGPTLIRFGTEEQRSRFLPPILTGKHIWCQGFSEPNAGSDLAALRTDAAVDGDCFVVTGQKLWTTLAQDATHMFALVRTSRDEPRRQMGISFLLMDLKVPAVTVRPLKVLSGHEEFCEVFFDGVRVPRANLVGQQDEGWTIAKALLGFERIYLGSPKQARHALNQLQRFARQRGLFKDAAFCDRFAGLRLDVMDLASAYARFADIVRRGESLGPDVSILKIWGAETYQRITEQLVEAAGDFGGHLGNEDAPGGVDVLSHYYNARPSTVYGGSSEIQRNILAKNVLSLPS